MNKFFLRLTGFVLLFMVNIFSSCQKEEFEPTIPAKEIFESENGMTSRAASAVPNLNKLADTLVSRLNNRVVGYSLVVSYKNQASVFRAGGWARGASDPPTLPMSINVKYSIASVSKTITATALLNLLNSAPYSINMLDWPVWHYLPSHWTFGPNFKSITFRELLQHKSGLRNGESDGNNCTYQSLKSLVAKGIILSDKSVSSYNNRNYALMRLLIPVLAKYNITIWNPNVYPSFMLTSIENTQATQLATFYKDYCRKKIFSKLTTCLNQNIDCNNYDVNPGLSYTILFGFNGSKVGDLTMSSGGQGWVLTTAQMYDFFKTLHYTENILPKSLSEMMKSQQLGYFNKGTTSDGLTYYSQNGAHNFGTGPYAQYYRSLIIGFSDDIQISVMTNSLIGLDYEVVCAHENWKQ